MQHPRYTTQELKRARASKRRLIYFVFKSHGVVVQEAWLSRVVLELGTCQVRHVIKNPYCLFLFWKSNLPSEASANIRPTECVPHGPCLWDMLQVTLLSGPPYWYGHGEGLWKISRLWHMVPMDVCWVITTAVCRTSDVKVLKTNFFKLRMRCTYCCIIPGTYMLPRVRIFRCFCLCCDGSCAAA